MGSWGGVSARRIDETTISLYGRGNAFTSAPEIENLLRIRAARETLAAGYDLFYFYDAKDASRTNYVATDIAISAVDIPAGTALVKMLKGAKAASSPPGLYDAREIIRFAEAAR